MLGFCLHRSYFPSNILAVVSVICDQKHELSWCLVSSCISAVVEFFILLYFYFYFSIWLESQVTINMSICWTWTVCTGSVCSNAACSNGTFCCSSHANVPSWWSRHRTTNILWPSSSCYHSFPGNPLCFNNTLMYCMFHGQTLSTF